MADGLALAGFGLRKDLLLRVARSLLADIYSHVKELMAHPETPQIPDEADALIRMAHICGRIEQVWRRSFYDVACEMYPAYAPGFDTATNGFSEKFETLVYRTIMSCIGHGIGPDDENGACNNSFPGNLSPRPINIENPMFSQLEMACLQLELSP